MINKKIYSQEEARPRMLEAVNVFADVVGSTMGLGGSSVLLGGYGQRTKMTKDGVSVGREIFMDGDLENLVISVLKEAQEIQLSKVGDATTTAAVLSAALFDNGVRFLDANPDTTPRQFKGMLATALKNLLERLETFVVDESEYTLEDVAAVSLNGDTELAKLVAEIIGEVGEVGTFRVERNHKPINEVEFVNGMVVSKGMPSPYFATNAEKMELSYENAAVFVTDREITSSDMLIPVLQQLPSGTPLVVVCKEIKGEALSTLVQTKMKKGMPIAVVEADRFGIWQQQKLDDIASLTGATFFSIDKGLDISLVNQSDLGFISNIEQDLYETKFIAKEIKDKAGYDEKVAYLTNLIEENGPEDVETPARLANLTGKVGVLKLFAVSDSEFLELFDRADDALKNVKSALKGVVLGGGLTLMELGADNEEADEDIAMLVYHTLLAPYARISDNAGIEFSQKDMKAQKIYDSKEAIATALESAFSTIGTLLTTAYVIVEQKPE